jgi:hypothetical protein
MSRANSANILPIILAGLLALVCVGLALVTG